MDIKSVYDIIGGDYEGTVARMCGEERVARFITKFAKDPSYNELCDSIAANDWETAFRASHTMKGVCSNFGFTKLQQVSSDLCETLRPGSPNDDTMPLFEEVKKEYAVVIDALEQLD